MVPRIYTEFIEVARVPIEGLACFFMQLKEISTEAISNKLVYNPLFGYRKLIAWQKANELAEKIYVITSAFPKHEMFGITSQLRRSILSVPLNIVEGYSRNSKKEFHRFLAISLGSLAEAEYLINFSLKQLYMTNEQYNEIILLKEEVGRIIWKLYQSQKS